jgi:hypothetical protein
MSRLYHRNKRKLNHKFRRGVGRGIIKTVSVIAIYVTDE